MRKIFLTGLLLLLPGMLAAQQQIMNNDSVIRMTQAGMSENVIITMIATSPGVYNTSVDGLIALKEAGVDDKIIEAMVAKAAGAPTPAESAAAPPELVTQPPQTEAAVTYGPPAVFPPETKSSQGKSGGIKQSFGASLKILAAEGATYYGPTARFWIKNKVGIEGGFVVHSESYMGISAHDFIIPISALFSLTHANAGGLYIRPYVGGGVTINHVSVDSRLSVGDLDFYGGHVLFGAELTPSAVPRLSFGPRFEYHYLELEGRYDYSGDRARKGWMAGVNVTFYIF